MGIFDIFKMKQNKDTNNGYVELIIPDEYKEEAIEVVKKILTALHEKRYADILSCVDESKYEFDELIFEIVEERSFDNVDEYGVPCNFKPAYEYKQMIFYPYNDGSGFALDYDLTTSSELMDLSLELEFFYTEDGLKKVFITIDPQ